MYTIIINTRLSEKSFKMITVIRDEHTSSTRSSRHSHVILINIVMYNSNLRKGSFLKIYPKIE